MIDFEIFEKEERIEVSIVDSISDNEFEIKIDNYWEWINRRDFNAIYTVMDNKMTFTNKLSREEYFNQLEREIIKTHLLEYLKAIRKIK